jgi:hypothetical protein
MIHRIMIHGTHSMLNTTVFSFCVLSDGHQVDIFVWSVISFNRFARANIGIQVEFSVKVYHSIIGYLLFSVNYNAYFRKARLRDLCPFPIGVASGPFKPTLFLLTESMAFCGMWKRPSGPLTGVTSTDSQVRGTYAILVH